MMRKMDGIMDSLNSLGGIVSTQELELSLFLGLYLWDYVDGWHSANKARQYKPFPLPPVSEVRYRPSNVSIVVPTVNWDENLPNNIISWLRNRPHELIFVTLEGDAVRLRETIESEPAVSQEIVESKARVKILTVRRANKRRQLCLGISEAKGSIIAFVDDDALWTNPQTLIHLLAPFQKDDVGVVGGPIGSYVPEERQNSKVITSWEVAALRIRQKREPGMAAFFAADGSTNFTVSGLTMLLRAEIVRDPYFQFLFTHDMWDGVAQNTGDDGFITRYILFQHLLPHRGMSSVPMKQWKIGIQLTPEAQVLTSLMTDKRFAFQSQRWYRNGLRLRLTCLLYEPGYRLMRRTVPYFTRKMVGGMINPIFTAVRAYLWYCMWRDHPRTALALLLYVLYNWLSSLYKFYRRFPYCGPKIWAAMIADNLYLISDFYSWATLSTESWANRESA